MEFTIDDVNAWINCRRDAGRRVWLDSNFAVAMAREAMHIKGLSDKFGRGEKVLKPIRSTGKVSAFGAEEMAWDTVFEVQEWVKKTYSEEEKRFDNKGQFIEYVRKTIHWRLTDKILDQRQVVPLPQLVSDEGDDLSDHLKVYEDPHASKQFQLKDIKRFINQCEDRAKSLMDCFIKTDFLTKTLKNRLTLLLQLSHGEALGSLGVLFFIEKNKYHILFHNKAKEILKEDFNQSTWNSYNLRLKDAWYKFLESEEGKSLNEGFKECREAIESLDENDYEELSKHPG